MCGWNYLSIPKLQRLFPNLTGQVWEWKNNSGFPQLLKNHWNLDLSQDHGKIIKFYEWFLKFVEMKTSWKNHWILDQSLMEKSLNSKICIALTSYMSKYMEKFSVSKTLMHKNILSCVENECCCPRTVDISNFNLLKNILLMHHGLVEYSRNQVGRPLLLLLKHPIVTISCVRRPYVTCYTMCFSIFWRLELWNFGILVLKYHWNIIEIFQGLLVGTL